MNAFIDNPSVQLRHEAAPADAVCLASDGRVDRETMLACLATHFQFPVYYGDNWDAAYDLLLDKVDALSVDTVWRFNSGPAVQKDPDAITSFLQLMQDIIDYASDQGIRLQVELFLDSGEVD